MGFDKETMSLTTPAGVTVPLLEIDGCVWFRGNDCASVLLFKDGKKAIKRHVEEEWQKPLKELLQTGGAKITHHQNCTLKDLNAKWISEPGLYDLASSSKLPEAKSFKKWVFAEVLPAIRKTGSYTLPNPTIQPAPKDGWAEKRAEGIELMKLKNATLKELIAGGFGQMGTEVYGIVANNINQAVLGYADSTEAYKRRHQLPNKMSIPDILNLSGQVARGFAETSYREMISSDLERLQSLRSFELKHELNLMKNKLRKSFEMLGMGQLQKQVLSLGEAIARKAAKAKAKIGTKALPPAKKQKLLKPMQQQKLIACC